MALLILQEETQLPKNKKERLEKQQYRTVGNHSAVKICFWCKKSIQGTGECYKQDFYKIDSHRCLEMSPAITCNKRCKHCWRDTSVFSTGWKGPIDSPKEIIEGCIKARTKLLNGFKGSKTADKTKVEESFMPTNVAISLTGEPMMYPRYPELIKEFFKSGLKTVFAVTSGTVPETIKKLDVWPTNVYLSVEAWDYEMYKKLCIPVISDAWEKFLESAELLKNAPTRTIMRITCMKELNMDAPEKFAFLAQKMQPDIIECKSYAWMGYSKQRMKRENTPNYEEVKEFAQKLGTATGYELSLSKAGSDIVLLRRITKRTVGKEEFIYEGPEKEIEKQEEHLQKIMKLIY